MKNSEEAIEKVLSALRDAETPAGMELRILKGFEEQASGRRFGAQSRLERGWLGLGWCGVPAGYVACGVALAGVFALVLVVPAIRKLGHAPAQLKSGVVPIAPIASFAAAAHGFEISSDEAGSRWSVTTNAPGTGLVRDADAVDSPDEIAWSEMRAASQPAPPMPLTEQEKLLLRIAHRGDQVEMAMLDPVLRSVNDAEERAEYLKFFGQSTKPAAEQSATEQPTEQPAQQPTGEQAEQEKPVSDPSSMPQTTPTQSRTGDKE